MRNVPGNHSATRSSRVLVILALGLGVLATLFFLRPGRHQTASQDPVLDPSPTNVETSTAGKAATEAPAEEMTVSVPLDLSSETTITLEAMPPPP
jgi:hypothetical protein